MFGEGKIGGERRIRTYKGLRPPVFKTGALAVLPALQGKTIKCSKKSDCWQFVLNECSGEP